MQHTKYYSRASYNCAAHEDGSRVAQEIELACSTRKLTLVSHASSVQVTRQKYKNTCVLLHAIVNLDVSCTVSNKTNPLLIKNSVWKGFQGHTVSDLSGRGD